MSYEMAMLMNWLLVAAGLLSSVSLSDLFDGSSDSDDDDVVVDPDPVGDNLGLGDEDDIFVGSDGDDFILGQGGNDSIAGALGDDDIEGNVGDDILDGGAGDDNLSGGGDTDTLFGGDGDDVLSSDRTDGDADFTRGDSEVLDGGAGDDQLFFSSQDIATGGEGSDSFGLVDTGEGAAEITDFDPTQDNITIYVDGLTGAETPPVVSSVADAATGNTTVSLDGAETLVLEGLFSEDELAVTLEDLADIPLE